MTLIILEGPDGCGKSSLAEFIAREFDGPRPIQIGGPPKSAKAARLHMHRSVAYATRYSRSQAERPTDFCILDRVTAISQPCYESALDRPSICEWWEYQATVNALRDYKPLWIYCRTRKPNILQTDVIDTDEYTNQLKRCYPKLVNAYDSYMNALRWSGSEVYHYDFNEDLNRGKVHEYVSAYLSRPVRVR